MMIHNQFNGSPISKRTLVLTGVILGGITLLALAVSLGSTEQVLGASMLALIPAAFLSGVLSFLSPCSLPILPAYFAYSFQSSRKNIVIMTLAFFAGLATTMTLLGASVTAVSRLLVRNIAELSIIGGAVIILFGILSILGKGPTGIQFQDSTARTVGGSYIYGATFAIGWTACIGPILGAILTLLATQGAGIAQGALLSFVYTLGLGLPLFLISLFFSRLGNGSRFWNFIRGRAFTVRVFGQELTLHTTTLISGGLLIVMGVLLMTGTLNRITQLGLESNISAWVIYLDEQVRVLFGVR
jgi:cytochrome c-type biogenesis protein